ncbi:hypothetical protein JNW87_14935 [Micromonospora sp. ATA51]|nr:hypothetical protein [Micromonospora sp. ATA51]
MTGERALLRPFVDDDLADRLDLAVVDADRAGRTVLQATARFHHPAHAAEWAAPAVDDDLTAVIDVLLRGLGAR